MYKGLLLLITLLAGCQMPSEMKVSYKDKRLGEVSVSTRNDKGSE
jgi:hypothetical protein